MTLSERKQFIDYLRRAYQADILMEGIGNARQNLDIVIDFQLKKGITRDDFEALILEDLEQNIYCILRERMEEYNKRKSKTVSYSEDRYKYAGTYNSITEVPGYGTEWNDRCKPEGVIIRGSSKRC